MKELMKKLLIELPIRAQQKTQDKDEEASTFENPEYQTMTEINNRFSFKQG